MPALRKLEQFDQIMTEYGLWDREKWDGLKEDFMENHGILLRTSLSPRKIATLTGGLPRCMESLTPAEP